MTVKKLQRGDIELVARNLTNPDVRVRLRADFPRVCSMQSESLLARIEDELAKCGETLHSIGEINLVAPQKDPDIYRGHRNPALPVLAIAKRKLRNELRARGIAASKLKITRQDAICEMLHLDRSSGPGVWHSLTRRQHFNVNATRYARNPTAFLSQGAEARKHYFVIVDWHIMSGTTVANLASFITHNGGHVLTAAVNKNQKHRLIPDQQGLDYRGLPEGLEQHLSPQFLQSTCSARTMASLAYHLCHGAFENGVKDVRLNKVLERAERALNRHGHSLMAMTHSEAYSLLETLQFDRTHSYKKLMKLGREKPRDAWLVKELTRKA